MNFESDLNFNVQLQFRTFKNTTLKKKNEDVSLKFLEHQNLGLGIVKNSNIFYSSKQKKKLSYVYKQNNIHLNVIASWIC